MSKSIDFPFPMAEHNGVLRGSNEWMIVTAYLWNEGKHRAEATICVSRDDYSHGVTWVYHVAQTRIGALRGLKRKLGVLKARMAQL